MEEGTMLTNELNEITSNIVVEFFIGRVKESEDESWRAASNRLEIYIRIYIRWIRIVYYSLWNSGKSYSGGGRNSIPLGREKGLVQAE